MLNAFLMVVVFSSTALISFEIKNVPFKLRAFVSQILFSKCLTKKVYIVLDSKFLTNENPIFKEPASLVGELSHLSIKEASFHEGLGLYTITFKKPTDLAALQGLKNIEPAIKEISDKLNTRDLFHDRFNRGSQIRVDLLPN